MEGGVTAIFEFGGHIATVRSTHASYLVPSEKHGACFLSQTRASWIGLASFEEGSSSLAVCCSMEEQCVGIAEAQAHNDNQPPIIACMHACGAVGCSPSPELGVSGYTAICRDTVSEIPREYYSKQYNKYKARHTLCLLCGPKPQSRPALGSYRTGVWFRLARPFLIEIRKKFFVHR